MIDILTAHKNKWNLGSNTKDPRGVYQCKGSKDKSKTLQVYYRPLKDREDDQYSHLQGNQLRRN
uniref:CD3 gamma subunit of T-cell receptor complex n=1 Tax=Mandrillus leucophaeus TaxID=9568 RepID=A0A2K5XLQ0_MANLE